MSNETVFRESVEYIQKKIKGILEEVSDKDIENVKKLFFKSNRIFVYGAGRSGLVAKAFAIRLIHLGYQTFVIGETVSAPVTKGDLVLIVSGSGETIPAVMTAEIAHKLKANVISITAKKKSEIAKYADVTLFISSACNEKERKKRFSGAQVLAIVAAVVVLTAAVTMAVAWFYLYPRPFKPVVLSPAEQQELAAKLDRVEAVTGRQPPGADRPAKTKTLEPDFTPDGRLQPRAYTEEAADREVTFSERELNALIATNTDLADKFAVDLADNLVSARLLVPVDPDFPIFGGKVLRAREVLSGELAADPVQLGRVGGQ